MWKKNRQRCNFCEVQWLLFKHLPVGPQFSNSIELRQLCHDLFTSSIPKRHLDLALLPIGNCCWIHPCNVQGLNYFVNLILELLCPSTVVEHPTNDLETGGSKPNTVTHTHTCTQRQIEIDRQIHRKIDRQKDRQIDRQIDRQRQIEIDRQIDREREREMVKILIAQSAISFFILNTDTTTK